MATCTSANFATLCKTGYYLTTSSGTCVACGTGANVCASNTAA